jgi:hypothetical protein
MHATGSVKSAASFNPWDGGSMPTKVSEYAGQFVFVKPISNLGYCLTKSKGSFDAEFTTCDSNSYVFVYPETSSSAFSLLYSEGGQSFPLAPAAGSVPYGANEKMTNPCSSLAVGAFFEKNQLGIWRLDGTQLTYLLSADEQDNGYEAFTDYGYINYKYNSGDQRGYLAECLSTDCKGVDVMPQRQSQNGIEILYDSYFKGKECSYSLSKYRAMINNADASRSVTGNYGSQFTLVPITTYYNPLYQKNFGDVCSQSVLNSVSWKQASCPFKNVNTAAGSALLNAPITTLLPPSLNGMPFVEQIDTVFLPGTGISSIVLKYYLDPVSQSAGKQQTVLVRVYSFQIYLLANSNVILNFAGHKQQSHK